MSYYYFPLHQIPKDDFIGRVRLNLTYFPMNNTLFLFFLHSVGPHHTDTLRSSRKKDQADRETPTSRWESTLESRSYVKSIGN